MFHSSIFLSPIWLTGVCGKNLTTVWVWTGATEGMYTLTLQSLWVELLSVRYASCMFPSLLPGQQWVWAQGRRAGEFENPDAGCYTWCFSIMCYNWGCLHSLLGVFVFWRLTSEEQLGKIPAHAIPRAMWECQQGMQLSDIFCFFFIWCPPVLGHRNWWLNFSLMVKWIRMEPSVSLPTGCMKIHIEKQLSTQKLGKGLSLQTMFHHAVIVTCLFAQTGFLWGLIHKIIHCQIAARKPVENPARSLMDPTLACLNFYIHTKINATFGNKSPASPRGPIGNHEPCGHMN